MTDFDVAAVLEAIRAGGKPECGWVKLYTASGAYVTLPVTVEGLDYAAMLANVDAMLACGFTVLAPGLEEGEQKDVCGYVARRAKTNRDGTDSGILDLYPESDGTKFKFLSVYIDNDDDVKAFEFASGLEFEHLPLYEGQQAIERGNARTDKFVIKAPHPFGVVFGKHPKYNAEDAAKATQGKPYTIPKKQFRRWEKERPTATSSPPSKDLTPAQAESLWKEAKDFLATDPDIQAFNDWIKQYCPAGPRPVVDRFWQGIRAHAKAAGFVWSERDAVYTQPQGEGF